MPTVLRATLVGAIALGPGGCKDDTKSAPETTGAGSGGASTGPGATTSGVASSSAGERGVADSTGGSTGGPPSACAASAIAISDCIDLAAYTADLEFISELRVPGSTHWQAVQDLGADRLTEHGFDVDLFEYGTGVNVIATREGTMPDAARVMVGAHYDHIPDCAGADDNATGVAAALEIARVLAEGTFERPLTIALWDEEEDGLIGSEAFVAAATGQGLAIEAYYNLEMLGYASDEPNTQTIPVGFDLVFPDEIAVVEANEFRGDFLFVVADDLAATQLATLVAHAERVELPTIAVSLLASQKNNDLFADLRRSDHAPFWLADYPAIFLTDTGEFRNQRYHCMNGEDTVDSLVPAFTEQVMRTVAGSAAESLGLIAP
ncbi:MAG: M20/M25/M40 family metallo-hydrolase [Myxococcota bacterium]